MEAEPFHFDIFFLHRFKEGNESAFEEVFKTGYNRIVGFCQQFTGDKDQAQSLAQEAFVKLWLNREKIETVNGIRSFLYTAAKTDCLNYIRHKKVIGKYQDKQLQLKEGELNREILESFDFDQLELLELETMIIRSINELPEKCRLVFVLSRMEGKKNCEIATQLDITVKSVEANMTRALKTLRLKLAEYLPLILVQLIMKNF
ncbi:MAG: RNA polymerase sigma-70 factor [Bacteroidetes bacterium]|nr:RNA polymerase sigma-70 factor [Bacteroidota bacterium]